jgi:hypothetical protein
MLPNERERPAALPETKKADPETSLPGFEIIGRVRTRVQSQTKKKYMPAISSTKRMTLILVNRRKPA